MNKLKDLKVEERPRERLVSEGVSSLSLAEVLAILFRTGSKQYSVIELSNMLIASLSSLQDLKDITIQELSKINGIGRAKATTILAAIELGKRIHRLENEKIKITTGSDVFHLFEQEFIGYKQETLYCIFLDLKSNIITKKQVFVGSLNQSLIHPREVFKYAVKYSAYTIILIHNHPSGDPTPSRADIEVTKRFIEIGELLQIKVVDHIVVGENRYESIMKYI